MTIKTAAELQQIDARDRQNSFDVSFLKTACEEFGLDQDEAIRLRVKFAAACQADIAGKK
jgi:hypothetical protein